MLCDFVDEVPHLENVCATQSSWQWHQRQKAEFRPMSLKKLFRAEIEGDSACAISCTWKELMEKDLI